MSRLLRSELKEIVKECLVEILSEGIGGTKNKPSKKNIRKSVKTSNNIKKNTLEKRRNYLESMEYGDIPTVKDDKVKVNTNITADPILNSILADTAKTTLQEQLSADRRGGGTAAPIGRMDAASQLASKSEPADLFGKEASGKWAQLAFFDQ